MAGYYFLERDLLHLKSRSELAPLCRDTFVISINSILYFVRYSNKTKGNNSEHISLQYSIILYCTVP